MQLRVEPNSNALGNTIALSQHQSIKPLTPSRSNLTSPTVLSANMKQHAPAHVNLLHNLEHPIEASKTRPLVLQNFVPPIDEPVKSHAASAFASGGFALTHFCCSFKMPPDAVSRTACGVPVDGVRFCAEARLDRKSTRLNSSHSGESRMPSSA